MHRIVRHTRAAAGWLAAGCLPTSRPIVADVDPQNWSQGVEVVLPNADTLNLYDASLLLRCNARFAEDTLTVRIALQTPDSLHFEEPFRLTIPRIRRPAALTREVLVPYRHRMLLARSGDYLWTVAPVRPVQGVEAVGLDFAPCEPDTDYGKR